MFATARTVTLSGATGHVVDVQVDVSQGTPNTSIVGRPDPAINEARARCRAAVDNSDRVWPTTRRVTVLLSPADLPKRGTQFDLAIALGVIAASDNKFPPAARALLARTVLLAELSLDGRVRCVPGLLPMVMAARARGFRSVIVPEPQVDEARLVDDLEVFGVRSLGQALAVLGVLDEIPDAPPVEPPTAARTLSWRGQERLESTDLADVIGMEDARFALEVAAAGGHHLMLVGPKGAGKTTLAERLPTILPDLDRDQALELTAIHSLCGTLPAGAAVLTRPPFRAPHHTASRAGVLGGGTGQVRPGEVSKAHHGVLFLDEFPLLPTDIIEALRQPLESREITIARGDDEATFPAGGMLVLAANPCPCGDYSPNARDHACECPEVRRREYRRRLTGPIADRIDITRFVTPPPRHEQDDPLAEREPSATVLARVVAARARQAERYGGTGWRLNASVPGPELRERWPLTTEAAKRLDKELYAGVLTRRGGTRVHRLAWTLADLEGRERPGLGEVENALRLRAATPLPVSALTRGRA